MCAALPVKGDFDTRPLSVPTDGIPVVLKPSPAAAPAAPATWPRMQRFRRLDIGYQECHIFNQKKEVWLDDIAVSTSPVGCEKLAEP